MGEGLGAAGRRAAGTEAADLPGSAGFGADLAFDPAFDSFFAQPVVSAERAGRADPARAVEDEFGVGAGGPSFGEAFEQAFGEAFGQAGPGPQGREGAGSGAASELDALSRDAEEVRAWFVHARGGGPFLSGKDGRILVDWLEAGVPVSAILIAIEKVAIRRQAKRTRAPFHLDECAATLRKLVRHRPAKPRRGRGAVAPLAEERLGERLSERLSEGPNAGGPLPDGGWGPLNGAEEGLVQRTLRRLSLIGGRDREEGARLACVVVREFHEELWALMEPQHPALLAEAREQLADLIHARDADAEAMVREQARRSVMARHPQISVSRVWEEYLLGTA